MMARLVSQSLAELTQQRDGLQQRVEQLGVAFEAHKSSLAAERDAQALHLRTVEDRAHAEVDRAREETKALQATLRQKERETSTIASRLEAAVTSVRAAEHLATEQGARAKTLEQQLGRMDGVPAALLAAQQSLQAALQHETVLQAKLDHLVTSTKIQPAVRKQKSRKASGAA
jgi:chromosome segregation ATPase